MLEGRENKWRRNLNQGKGRGGRTKELGRKRGTHLGPGARQSSVKYGDSRKVRCPARKKGKKSLGKNIDKEK